MPAYIDKVSANTNMTPAFSRSAGKGKARMNIVITGAMNDIPHPAA